MTNNAPGGCGNDLALDDITFSPCGPKVDAAFANIANAGDSANYCITDNKSITISGSVQAGFNNPAFQWQQSLDKGRTWTDMPGATTNSITQVFSNAGIFEYRLSVAETGNIGIARCRVASNPLRIIIDAIPVVNARSTSPACVGDTLQLLAEGGGLYSWTGPNGFNSSSSNPRLLNIQISAAGLYSVLVQTNGGCSKQDATQVIVNPLPLANAGAATKICENTSTVLNASGGVRYLWSPVVGLSNPTVPNPVASPLVTTTYTVFVTNQFMCTLPDSVLVTVLKNPVANAGPDKKITEGQSVQLNGVASGDVQSYFWTPAQFIDNVNLLTPTVNPGTDFTYTLHVQSGNGCGVASDDVFVRVFRKINIPNAFSPNGDGINDVWNIAELITYPESVTKVFNRYGQLVFYSNGYAKPWDGTFNGKPLPFGVYYYIIDRKNNFPLVNGSLTIIR